MPAVVAVNGLIAPLSHLASLLARGAAFESYTHGVDGCADAITVRRYLERAPFTHRFHAITPAARPGTA